MRGKDLAEEFRDKYGDKIYVIGGRGGDALDRTGKFANKIGAEVYEPGPKLGSDAKDMQAMLNVLWDKMDKGHVILDIGPIGPSTWYEAETALLDVVDYSNWIQITP